MPDKKKHKGSAVSQASAGATRLSRQSISPSVKLVPYDFIEGGDVKTELRVTKKTEQEQKESDAKQRKYTGSQEHKKQKAKYADAVRRRLEKRRKKQQETSVAPIRNR